MVKSKIPRLYYIYLHKVILLKKLLDTKPSKAVIREKRKMDQNTRLLKFIKSAIASSFKWHR